MFTLHCVVNFLVYYFCRSTRVKSKLQLKASSLLKDPYFVSPPTAQDCRIPAGQPHTLYQGSLWWRNGEKIIFFRSEVLEKRVEERGKSPLPADKVRRSVKKFNLGRWQEYNNVAMWTYEVTWSARKKELSQRSSFSRPIFFDIWELFGSL